MLKEEAQVGAGMDFPQEITTYMITMLSIPP